MDAVVCCLYSVRLWSVYRNWEGGVHEGGWSGPCHAHRLCPLSLWPQLPWKHRILDRLVRVSTVVLRLHYRGELEWCCGDWSASTNTNWDKAGQEKIWLKFFLTQTHSEFTYWKNHLFGIWKQIKKTECLNQFIWWLLLYLLYIEALVPLDSLEFICRNTVMEITRGGRPKSSLEIPVGGNGRLYGLTSVSECPRSKCEASLCKKSL